MKKVRGDTPKHNNTNKADCARVFWVFKVHVRLDRTQSCFVFWLIVEVWSYSGQQYVVRISFDRFAGCCGRGGRIPSHKYDRARGLF
jgi:hypothetical protein